jgi:hypothetical protein
VLVGEIRIFIDQLGRCLANNHDIEDNRLLGILVGQEISFVRPST